MAVVQISKIQVRRGRKSLTGDVPQLSSGEIAWAIDSQELYIGNGSIAEGAPYVGNTKILTEHDNLLDLDNSYKFENNNPTIVYSIERSLQSKLDESVSIIDYGAVPDGSTDCTDAFHRAFEDLFLNSDDKFKKPLFLPNGRYLISQSLVIPTDAFIVGENFQETVIDLNSNNIELRSSEGDLLGNFSSSNRPQNIRMSELTFECTTGNINLTALKDSLFEQVKFVGDYNLSDSQPALSERSAMISWTNNELGLRVDQITFKNCVFEFSGLAVRCDQTTAFETEIIFENSVFSNCETGVYINGISEQNTFWKFNDCEFREIYSYAFLSTFGRGTIFHRSRFINCGNGTNNASNPISSIISFGESFNNTVYDSYFDRHQNANISLSNSIVAIPEVSNSSVFQSLEKNYASISKSNSPVTLAVFPASNRFITIDYSLTLGSWSRVGKIYISIDVARSRASISDDYIYSPETPSSQGGALMTNFEFSIQLSDNDADTFNETLVLSYVNPSPTWELGNISYSISYGV